MFLWVLNIYLTSYRHQHSPFYKFIKCGGLCVYNINFYTKEGKWNNWILNWLPQCLYWSNIHTHNVWPNKLQCNDDDGRRQTSWVWDFFKLFSSSSHFIPWSWLMMHYCYSNFDSWTTCEDFPHSHWESLWLLLQMCISWFAL